MKGGVLDHPMWGKEKLGPILRKQGYATSNATVGRIIGALIRHGSARSRPDPQGRRQDSAQEAPPTPSENPDLVQIDTLSIYPLPGVSIKHFNAYDPFAWKSTLRKREAIMGATEFSSGENLSIAN